MGTVSGERASSEPPKDGSTMGLQAAAHTLTWQTELTEAGYTALTLVDQEGRRWGWAVNAGAGWMAHVGSWGQSTLPIKIDETLKATSSTTEAKDWIETQLAEQWHEAVTESLAV